MVSPFIRPLRTLLGWHELKCRYWKVLVGLKWVERLKMLSLENFFPFLMSRSRKVAFESDNCRVKII